MKAVIFDLDGVLCSTDEYHYLAWKNLADSLGIAFDREKNNRLRGVSREQSLEIILEGSEKIYTAEEKASFAERKNRLYRFFLSGLSEKDISQETLFTLAALKTKGIKIAVASSSKNTPLILLRLGIADMFDVVVDGNDISRSKPDPEVFLKTADRLGLLPSECLVVEDAESGIQAGKAGGFVTAAVGEAARLGLGNFRPARFCDILAFV